MLRAGNLDRVIRIEERQIVDEDASGTEIAGWVFAKKRWARILYGTGQERRQAAQESATQPATIIMRYDSYTALMKSDQHRLFFDDVNWDIEGIVKIQRQGEVSITATARVN